MNLKTISCALAILVAGSAWAQESRHYDDRPKITVSGEAVVSVKPDKVVITLGIETSDKDISNSKAQNNEILQRTIARLKEIGVPEKEMQTDNLSIEPRWRHSNHENFIGYFVRNTLVVTITDVDTVEAVITGALKSGVNYIHNVDFQTTDFREHREQARVLALKEARDKADKMAAVLGQKAGRPLMIQEGHSPWWHHSSWTRWGASRSHTMSQVMVQADRGDPGETTDSIALGKLNIRANVTVTFELEQ